MAVKSASTVGIRYPYLPFLWIALPFSKINRVTIQCIQVMTSQHVTFNARGLHFETSMSLRLILEGV